MPPRYWQGTDYAGQEFSTRSGAVLQYTTAQGANLLGAQDRASSYVRPWLDELYTANTGDTRFAPMGTGFGQWNVATSATAGAVALARDLDQTQMFIGQGGNDTFNGGNGYGFFWASAQACNDFAHRCALHGPAQRLQQNRDMGGRGAAQYRGGDLG